MLQRRDHCWCETMKIQENGDSLSSSRSKIPVPKNAVMAVCQRSEERCAATRFLNARSVTHDRDSFAKFVCLATGTT